MAGEGYERLPGVGRSLLGSSRLYLGDDHLLLVQSTIGRESYRRVGFSDLQAILVRDSRRFLVWMVALGLTLAVVSAATLATGGAARIFWSVSTGLVAAVTLLHLVRGRTCVTHARTPIQWIRLSPLSRWGRTDAALGRLRARVQEAQGAASAEAIRAGYETIEDQPAPTRAAAPVTAGPAVPASPYDPGHFHAGLAMLLLADAVVSFIQLQMGEHLVADAVGTVVFLLWAVASLAVVIRQGRREVAGGLRVWGWVTLVYAVVMVGVMVMFSFVEAMIQLGGELPDGAFQNARGWVTGFEVAGSGALYFAWLLVALTRRSSR